MIYRARKRTLHTH